MGEMEQAVAAELRATRMRLAILSTIKASGLLATVLIAPNVAGVLARAMNRSHNNSTRSSLKRLSEAGLIIIDKGHARLTDKGARFLDMHLLTSARPRTWDKQWRVVIFDIPESRRKVRDRLRDMLETIGFLKLQDSVWIYPYDREDLVALIKTELRTGRGALYMIVHRVENDGRIRAHFGL